MVGYGNHILAGFIFAATKRSEKTYSGGIKSPNYKKILFFSLFNSNSICYGAAKKITFIQKYKPLRTALKKNYLLDFTQSTVTPLA